MRSLDGSVGSWEMPSGVSVQRRLEDCPSLEADLRERQAMCRWRLGQAEPEPTRQSLLN